MSLGWRMLCIWCLTGAVDWVLRLVLCPVLVVSGGDFLMESVWWT